MFKKIFTVTFIAIALGLATLPSRAEQVTTDGPKALEVPANSPATPLPAIDPATWALVKNAVGWLGVPYRPGGKTAERGFDCSGFVGAVFKKTFGLVLPPSALTISKIGQPISFEELRIGDLIFFNTLRRPFSHIGIYMGEGRFIHACSTANQIKIDNLDQYYKKRLNGFRRINLD
ncbi:MAG TPA: C40 family peptidase [Desulfurivibrionaceae bacterium]|nr:C40 family peptidase [Desulfurivibrionaceae bacterium]